MKRITYFVVLLMLAMPFVGMAQEKKITFYEKKYQEEYNALNQKEWTSLFNGKDLQGWKLLEGKVPFVVKNGVIVGTATDDTTHSSFLSTTKNYSDFIFEVDFKMDR